MMASGVIAAQGLRQAQAERGLMMKALRRFVAAIPHPLSLSLSKATDKGCPT